MLHLVARRVSIIGLLALLALLLARAPLTGLSVALVALSLGLAVFIRPALGLLLLAFSVPFSTVGEITLAGAAVGPSEALLALTLAAWLAQRLAAGRLVLPRPWRRLDPRAASTGEAAVAPLLLPLLLYCAALAFSLLPATSLADAAPELFKWLETLILYLVAVDLLTPIGHRAVEEAIEIAPNSFGGPVAPNSFGVLLIVALLLAGVLQAAVGLYQFITQSGPPAFQILGRFLRAYGTFRQPNPYAGYLGLILPLALSLFWWALAQMVAAWPGRFTPSPRAEPPRRSFAAASALAAAALVVTALIAAGALASWSRGAWLGIGAGVVTVTALRSRRTFGLSLALAGALTVLLLARGGFDTGALGGRLAQVGDYLGGFDVTTVEVNDDNFAVVERVAHWVAAQRMIAQAPWQGVGVGNYAAVYPQVALPRWQDPLGHAHNIYLNTWAEAGLPGLLTYVLLWLLAAWQAVRLAYDRQTDALGRAVALGVLGAIVHLSIHNLFDNLLVQRLYLHMALLLALLASPPAAPLNQGPADTATRQRSV
ncbi:MAG: O-antigen ligase family protein [Anaerolineae bacterium]|nr:O-antigen ligase family protein [Anaerolineae bacterium]